MPVSIAVIVTVTPGSTPPELSETIPSMAPLAAVDWANAGDTSASDNAAERMYLSMIASIQRIYSSWRDGFALSGGTRRLRRPDPFLRSIAVAERDWRDMRR